MQETERLVLYKLLTCCLVFLLFSLNLPAQVYPDQKVDSLLKQGIVSIIKQDYDTAEKIFRKLDSEFSEIPLGKIYLAANKIAEAFDYGEPYDEEFITTNLECAKHQIEILLAKNENNVWHIYFNALVEGYTAYFEALKRNWITAFSTGFNSVSFFEKCLELDRNFYESYIAIGTFAYWKSKETEFLSWIPFISDDRDFAVKQLITAIDSASYNRYLAMNSLIWIYIDKKEYQSAITLAQTALAEFPGTRLFKKGLARAYEEINGDEAVDVYYKILESYPDRKNNTRINEIVLKHKIAQQYLKSGKDQEALNLCNQILSVKDLSDFEKDRLKRRLERITIMRDEISN